MVVPVGIGEGTHYLPQIGSPTLMVALQWIVIGILPLIFLWFRPQGLIPERRRIFRTEGGTGRRLRRISQSLSTPIGAVRSNS